MNTRIGERKNVAPSEEKLLKITAPMGNTMYRMRKAFHSDRILTAVELLCVAGVDDSLFTDEVKKVLKRKVSQVCRAGSRFSKDCICVQFDEDGNDVMRWAAQHGALLLVTRSQIDNLPCVVCENPEGVYAKMCRCFKNKSKTETIAVVGSIGKTTTKRMIGAVCSAQYNTFCDPENENQLDCVGYISQHIPPKTQILVQEVSEDYAGSVENISNVISPKIAVITAIDKSHIEQYSSEEDVVKEICSITSDMPDDGTVILNIDEDNIKNLSLDKRVVTVSAKNDNADYYAKNISIKSDGIEFEITDKKANLTYPVKLKYVYAKHNVISALYAFAAGVESGVSYDNIIKGLLEYRTAGIRQNIYTADGIYIYADCYNAVARSVRSAIEGAGHIPVSGRKIAVLGDVEEAGEFSEDTHRDIISAMAQSQFDMLFVYGDKLEAALKSFDNDIENKLKVFCMKNKSDISAYLKKELMPGDLILFKASRKSALEDIIKNLFSKAYRREMTRYYLPIIKWRLKVIFN